MFSVQNSQETHVPIIAQLLSDHYSEINDHFNKNLFRSDQAMLTKYITQRIQEKEGVFAYFSLMHGDEVVGFINTLVEPTYGEILVALIAPDHASDETYKLLVEHGIAYLQGQGKSDIRFETYELESNLNQTLSSLGAKKYTAKRFL